MGENFAEEADMQMDAGDREVEAPVPIIDFSARDDEVNRVDQPNPESIDFFARETQLNDVTADVAHPREEQSQSSVIDYVPLNNQRNDVAEQSDLVYYDFFNGENQVNAAASMAARSVPNVTLENELNAGANAAGQSGQDNDHQAPANQQGAAANLGEQTVLYIEYIDHNDIADQLYAAADAVQQSLVNIDPYVWGNQPNAGQADVVDYYDNENQGRSEDNVVHISFEGTDYNVLADQLRAAADMYQRSVLEANNIPLADLPTLGANGEMGLNDSQGLIVQLRYRGDSYSDYDEDALSEYEPFADDEQPLNEHPASRSFVRDLPSVTLTEESLARDTRTCSICQNEFNMGETAKELPCSHYYHEACILGWLDVQHTCPLCRYELPVDNDEAEENERAPPE